MESTRDLGQIELWQASLERSLARRGKLARSSVELYRLQPGRDLAAPDLFLESTAYWQARRRAAASRSGIPRPVVGLGGISALALVSATTLPTLLGGHRAKSGTKVALAAHSPAATVLGNGQRPTLNLPPVAAQQAPAPPAATPAVAQQPQPTTATVAQQETQPAAGTTPTVHAHKLHPTSASKPTTADHVARAPKPATPAHHPTTKPVPTHTAPPKSTAPKPAAPKTTSKPKPATSHKPAPPKPAPKRKSKPKPHPSATHVNPLAHASVTPERIDQGVDYAGSGTLTSIGRGRVTYVATSGSGWPGAFIEYQLLDGRYAGRYVYYAEGVRPASGIYVGRVLQAGQAVADLIPGWSTGIEVGWGAGIGSETLAAQRGDWSQYDDAHNIPSPEGQSFSSFIASLGGPPGR